MTKGKICLILSALIYGGAPILAKIAYLGGMNEMTLTFLRTSLTLPLLFIYILFRRKPLHLTKKQFMKITVLGVVGGTFAMLSLYSSYNYISTGLATTLHFIYPLVIVIVSALIYREKMSGAKLVSVMLVTTGIFLFVDLTNRADTVGVILAILSGILYSFYVIYLDRSGLDKMDYAVLTFYLLTIMSGGTLIFGGLTDSITLVGISPSAWVCAAVISIVVSLGAVPLFQAGVRYEGASTAGIISAVEPITTLILGMVFLNESMDFAQYFGGGLIIAGVVIAEKYR